MFYFFQISKKIPKKGLEIGVNTQNVEISTKKMQKTFF